MTRTRIAAALIAVFVVAGATAAYAITFSDVPSTSFALADIDAGSNAGCFQGVGGGKFDPSRSITREEEAAATHRCEGRVSTSNPQAAVTATIPTTAAFQSVPNLNVILTTGGVGGSVSTNVHFVHVHANVQFTTAAATTLTFQVVDNAGQTIGFSSYSTPAAQVNRVPLDGVFREPTATRRTFTLQLTTTAAITAVSGEVVATDIPFGTDGGNTINFT